MPEGRILTLVSETAETTIERMAIRNVVFDLDGTLVDSAPDIIECLRLAVAEAGIVSERPLTSALIGPPVSEMLRIWGEGLSDAQITSALAAFRRIYDASELEHTVPYPGITAALGELASAGVCLFVATNKPLRVTRNILHRRFPGTFADLCCVDSHPTRRLSKTEMLQDLSSRYGLRGIETAIVGDGESDMRAGAELGWRTMAVLYGYGEPDALRSHCPTWTVATPQEIAPKFIDERGRATARDRGFR